MESNTRSLAKAVSYRILGSAVTAMVVLAVTGRPGISAGVGLFDMVAKKNRLAGLPDGDRKIPLS